MSDDLMKRLRDSCYLAFDDGTNDYASAPEAADRIEELVAALLEAKSEMRDWGPDHPAMKMIDAALEGQSDD